MSEFKRITIPPRLRWQVLARDGFRCRYCGDRGGDAVLVVDHLTPVARGGTNDKDNLITACEPCNQGKSDLECPELNTTEVYYELGEQLVGWVDREFQAGAGVNWSADSDLLTKLILQSGSFGQATGIAEAFGLRVGVGLLSEERHGYETIMAVFSSFIDFMTRQTHPEFAHLSPPELQSWFWGHLSKFLPDAAQPGPAGG